jgi:hypothetical protein
MASRETWFKILRCRVCGLEGVAQLSHEDNSADSYETKTNVDECPEGFQIRKDEDDFNIVRFFCRVDNVAADD